ncbi:hypothetical protein GN956_G7502 [Arapaima gigas]
MKNRVGGGQISLGPSSTLQCPPASQPACRSADPADDSLTQLPSQPVSEVDEEALHMLRKSYGLKNI